MFPTNIKYLIFPIILNKLKKNNIKYNITFQKVTAIKRKIKDNLKIILFKGIK